MLPARRQKNLLLQKVLKFATLCVHSNSHIHTDSQALCNCLAMLGTIIARLWKCNLTCDLFWWDLTGTFLGSPIKSSANHCRLKGFQEMNDKMFVWSLYASSGLLTPSLPHLKGVWVSRVTQRIIELMKHCHRYPSLVKSNPRCHSPSGPTQSGFHGNGLL